MSIHVKDQTPPIGMKALVWDRIYKDWTLAYWTRDGCFEEWQYGKCRIIPADYWTLLPQNPEGENKSAATNARYIFEE